jgi:hypothetical protein
VTRTVTLLGPQRRPSLQNVVRDLDPQSTIAFVTAGWQERETDDAEIQEILGGRGVNLTLHSRWLEVQERDREYAHAEREHDAVIAELRGLYLTQLDHALRATYGIAQAKQARPRVNRVAMRDALEVVRLIDVQHLARVRDAQKAFYDAWRPEERAEVARHRDEVAGILGEADAVVIAGGHVGELVRVLHLFQVEPHLPHFVAAWSAGAMALAEQVVLFHDFVPHGVAQTEVFAEGLGVVRDLIPMPHVRRRLRTDDQVRMSVLARRFAPWRCLILDDGARVALTPEGGLPEGARVLNEDGQIDEVTAA